LAAAALPAALVGFTPALSWGAANRWANITYLLRLGGSGGTPGQHLGMVGKVTGAYFTCILPRIASGTLPTTRGILTSLHQPLLFVSVFFLLAALALVAASFIWRMPLLMQVRQLAALPVIFALCCAVAFCMSSAAVYTLLGCGYDDTGRYATPLALAFPFLFAALFTCVFVVIYERGRRQERERRRGARTGILNLAIVAQTILFVLLLVYLTGQGLSYMETNPGLTFQSNYCPLDPANNDPIIAYMQREHIHYFWASNLLAYPIVFKTNRSIIGADPRALKHHDAVNRIPEYTNAVLSAQRPSMLVIIRHSDPHPALLRALQARNIIYRQAIFPSQPGYDVLVVTPLSRTVSPLEKGFDIFQCYPSSGRH
jgi:hypothetical protein